MPCAADAASTLSNSTATSEGTCVLASASSASAAARSWATHSASTRPMPTGADPGAR